MPWKYELEYSHQRLCNDRRPLWIRNLGIHNVSLNGIEIKMEFPRLKYKRKIGSHVANPHADIDYIRKEVNRYTFYLEELRNR